MLLTDIVVDGIPEVDWTLHIPIMLHILFLGSDHTRPIVRDHCKQLLLNLLVIYDFHFILLDWKLTIVAMEISLSLTSHLFTCIRVYIIIIYLRISIQIVLAEHNDHLTVARVLLNSETSKLALGLTIPQLTVLTHNFTGIRFVDINIYLSYT